MKVEGGIDMYLLASSTATVMTIIWVIVILGSIILELATPNLTSVWFAIGGAVALVLNLLQLPLWLQLPVFILVSGALLFSIGKIARKKFLTKQVKTNVDAVIGQTLTIIKSTSENEPATVKYNGIYWNAVASDASPLHKGDVIIVTSVQGNKFIVKPSK